LFNIPHKRTKYMGAAIIYVKHPHFTTHGFIVKMDNLSLKTVFMLRECINKTYP
jgi:hypothetical protein